MKLTGRAVLVTGGRRIGKAVVTALASAGADVALSYHTSKGIAEQSAASLVALGRRAVVIEADLSRSVDCVRLVNEAAESLGRLDVLVNMASAYTRRAYNELREVDWDDALAVDLKASFLCAQAAVPHMRACGGGRIVNFADWVAASGRPRYPDFLPYYVAKCGVIALTEALALELADDQILVNAVAPGPIVPPDDLDDAARTAAEQATPLGRWGGDEAVVQVVRTLIETDFMTGETLRTDGGRHLR